MANILLKDTLSGKIAVEDVINWLTSDDVENSKWDDINKSGCSQCEFLLYFSNFLRDQTKSVLQVSYNARQTPTKTIRSYVPSNDNTPSKIEKPYRRVSLCNSSANQTPESRRNPVFAVPKVEDVQSIFSVLSKMEISPIGQNSADKLKKRVTPVGANAIGELQVLLNSQNAREAKNQSIKTLKITPDKGVGIEKSLSDDFTLSPNTTSTPIIDVTSSRSLFKKCSTFSGHSSSIATNQLCGGSGAFDLIEKESDTDFGRLEGNLNISNENVDILNCLSSSRNENVRQKLEQISRGGSRDSNSANTSSIFDASNGEGCNLNNLNTTNSSTMNESLNSLFVNGTCEDSISPIRINSSGTPQNCKWSYSRSVERCQNSKSSPQHTVDNTPKQGSQQRNPKTTPRQTASLGDFISIDTRGSRKNSAKKITPRTQSARSSDGEGSFNDRLSMTEESFPEIGKNCGRRRRRIKPTKLDVSDGKGNNENSAFGVICRPQTINPQFLEALATDKSDTTPFETERDLLRLERQKQQKVLPCNPSVENTAPNVSLKTSNVVKLGAPLLAPSLEHVENRRAIDILAQIYSCLLDNNLVLNPMTELNFVISLITLQHSFENYKCQPTSGQFYTEDTSSVAKFTCQEKSLDEAVTAESDESQIKKHEKSKECVNIELMKEELGCKVLNDDIASTIDTNTQLTNNFKFNDNKAFDLIDLTKLSLLDRKENNCTNKGGQSTERKEEIDPTKEEYFQTIHNCIYFSITFLNTQRVLLSMLDRATLKLLCENNRIATFLPDLQEYLNKCYKLKLNESSQRNKHFSSCRTTEANVSFQIDTDNHENFPSLGGFSSFRKQRDLFYEALKIWEVQHLASGWLFSIALAGKIRSLLTLHNDAANYCHFARLFKSQLLLSCIGNGPQEDSVDDETLSFLKSLKHVDPEKLTRLRERLVTPLSSKGPVPPPSFPGVQEFYKDFIKHASNPMFYAHLQDCLVHEIMELNDTQFTGSEIEDTETMVDEGTKHNFITCISSLRLLAKFLGFLVSLPYKSETIVIESVLATQLELRSQCLPPLDLQSCLHNAIVNGKLTLTIPWVVKYLAMLDPVSLRLPYYRTVLEILCYIYCESKHNSGLENPLSLQVVILLKFSIGWLFELCNFPVRLYFNCRMSQMRKKLKSIDNSSSKTREGTPLTTELQQTNDLNKSNNSSPCTDSLDIVDERSLYVCCPFLAELKALLTADHSNLNNSTTIRHITPVSSDFDKPFGSTSTKQLQLQLEEAFFHGQPISTRKTVDFVSERVASSCVKHICNFVLPLARENNLLKFQEVIARHTLPDDINKFKSSMSTEMNSIASRLSSDLKQQCEADILEMCRSRTTKSIESLLAEDTLPPVKEICSQIAIRMATERINHWIQSHITGGSLFMKDMEVEIDKTYKNKSVSTPFEKRVHNVGAASPTDVIIEIRSLIWELLDNKGQSVSLENVIKCLNNLYESLTERADLLPGPEKVLGTLSVDFALFLVAHKTDIFLPEVHDKLIQIWKMECLNFLENDSILSRIFSPRNIMLLAAPGNANVWLPLGQMIRRMLKEEVLSIEALSNQCTTLLRYDWPVEILKHLSTCLAEGIKGFQSTNEESEKMKLLLQWITETCSEMEFILD